MHSYSGGLNPDPNPNPNPNPNPSPNPNPNLNLNPNPGPTRWVQYAAKKRCDRAPLVPHLARLGLGLARTRALALTKRTLNRTRCRTWLTTASC